MFLSTPFSWNSKNVGLRFGWNFQGSTGSARRARRHQNRWIPSDASKISRDARSILRYLIPELNHLAVHVCVGCQVRWFCVPWCDFLWNRSQDRVSRHPGIEKGLLWKFGASGITLDLVYYRKGIYSEIVWLEHATCFFKFPGLSSKSAIIFCNSESLFAGFTTWRQSHRNQFIAANG